MFDWEDLEDLSTVAGNVLIGRRGHLPEVSDPFTLMLEEVPDLAALVRQLEVSHDSEESMVVGLGMELAFEEEESLDVDESVLRVWLKNPELTVLVLIDQSQGEPHLYVLKAANAR